MNFLENVFSISPDGGSGMLELTLFLIPMLGASAFLWLRRRDRA